VDFANILDTYDRRARLYPALLVIAPVAVLVACISGAYRSLASTSVTVLVACGAAYLLARVARDAGKRIEIRLFRTWGGAPTTQLLRHRDPHIDQHTKSRYHAVLSSALGKALPTAAEEAADPTAADDLYRAATQWLIGQTRDQKRYSLLFKENIAYGFHRNMLGLRPAGLLVSVGSIAITAASARSFSIHPPYLGPEALGSISPAIVVALVGSIGMLCIWAFFASQSAVKMSAYAYAARLLECCDEIRAPSSHARGKATTQSSKK
jgi:hypothetical protein